MADVIWGGGFVIVGAMVAPKKQFFIAIILLVIAAILGVLNLLGNLQTESIHPLLALLHATIYVASGVGVVYYLHSEETKNTSQPL